jgi:hypothetical protein
MSESLSASLSVSEGSLLEDDLNGSNEFIASRFDGDRQFKESDDGMGLTASSLMRHDEQVDGDSDDWFDYDGVVESEEEDEDMETMIKSLYTSEIQIRRAKELKVIEAMKPKKRKKPVCDGSSVLAIGGKEKCTSQSRAARHEKLKVTRIHKRREQKKQERMEALRNRDLKECTFKPKRYTKYKLENRGTFMAELEEDLEMRKYKHQKRLKKDEDKLQTWFQPKTNPSLPNNDPRTASERLYSQRKQEEYDDHSEHTTKSKRTKQNSRRIDELYNYGKNRRQREKKRLEQAERKRIAEIRKPKINQKSVKLARHRQYMYIMNVLEHYCDTIKVTPDTAIPYRVLIDIFINIGFYRKTIVQGEELMFSDSEVTLHDEILKHLDSENIGFVKLENIIELINDLFESNNKIHDQFRTLLDCQLHSPPHYSSKIYDQTEAKEHQSPTKKISL